MFTIKSKKTDGLKAIYAHCEQPSLNGRVQHQLFATYTPVLRSFLRCLNPHLHFASGDLNRSDNRVRQSQLFHYETSFEPWLMRSAILLLNVLGGGANQQKADLKGDRG